MIKGKKGQDVEAIHYLVLGIILFIIIGVYLLFMTMQYTGTRSIAPIQAEVIQQRMLRDADGIIYESAGRAYPGIIDLDKYTTEQLESSLQYYFGSKPGAKVTLHTNLLEEQDQIIYLNKRQYSLLRPTADVLGAGRAYRDYLKMPVLVEKDGNFRSATLEIDLVVVRQ